MCRYANPSYPAEPEVWFRIRHVALDLRAPPVARFRDQRVEIALGPRKAFETANIGALTRRVAVERVVTTAPVRKAPLLNRRALRAPRIVGLLRKARAWRDLLDSGEVSSRAEIARREGITRARVTQVIGLLRLDPRIQKQILAMPAEGRRPAVTERALRPLTQVHESADQRAYFDLLVNRV